MNRSLYRLVLVAGVLALAVAGSCGGAGTPGASILGDGGPLLDVPRDGSDVKDLQGDLARPDIKIIDGTLTDHVPGPDQTTPPDAAADVVDVSPDAPTDTTNPDLSQPLDTVPEIVGPCGAPCSPYEICDEGLGSCLPNPLCDTDFCTGDLEAFWRLELDGHTIYVDSLEWPGVQGQKPLVPVTLEGALDLCRGAGRRLCSEAELTAACGNPGSFPYGDAYNGSSCNTDFPFKLAGAGTFAACHAPDIFAMDLVGNAVEWTSQGTLFGGSCFDGTLGRCLARAVPEGGYAHPDVVGFRCCTAPEDDLDNDGAPASKDCNESNPAIYVGAQELCDGLDNNCNGKLDDAADVDGDDVGACQDCNDEDPLMFPGAEDQVGDQIDQNCDGLDGVDADDDGYASVASGGDDCNDQLAAQHPGLPDVCDGLDNDCDGTPDLPDVAGECDDELVCTDDLCDSDLAACVHIPVTCNDGKACTDDYCAEPGGCVFNPNTIPCSDGDPCTEGDQCKAGGCTAGLAALDCDDQNPCTEDSCVPMVGCSNAPVDADCDDGDPCTVGDLCVEGKCLAGAGALPCDDANPCTANNCLAGLGCRYPAKEGPCDDQDQCTTGEHCVDGACGGGQMGCLCGNDQDCLAFDDCKLCNGVHKCVGPEPLHCVFDPTSVVVCDPSPSPGCSEYYCSETDGQCKFRLINSGGLCDDGKGCTLDDKCVSGTCTGATCASKGLECWQDSCVACAPKCEGKACGSDSCGGQCGACPVGSVCSAAFQCCVPNCTGKQCGDDGCGGSCGGCLAGLSCVGSECRGCGDAKCRDGETMCTCQTDCGNPCSGKQCGLNQCNWSCGTCPGAQDACINNWCYCQPWCSGKECGPSGCGTQCGSCKAGWSCVSGRCQGCGDGTCRSGENKCNCPSDCGNPCSGYECGYDPYGCSKWCGTCGSKEKCVSGWCV